MTSDKRGDVGVATGAAVGLEANDLRNASMMRLRIFLTQCMGVINDPNSPKPLKRDGETAFMTRVRADAPETAAVLGEWEKRGMLSGTANDELMGLMVGADFSARNAALNAHLSEYDNLCAQRYGEAYTTPLCGGFPCSARQLLDAIKRNDDALVQKIAVLLFSMSTEASVHRYFAGIDENGVVSTPRVDRERFREFEKYLQPALRKLQGSTHPFVNTHVFVALCVWQYCCKCPDSQ